MSANLLSGDRFIAPAPGGQHDNESLFLGGLVKSRHPASFFVTCVLLLLAALPVVAQEQSSALERANELAEDVRDLQARQETVRGEDRELYADILRRRSPELQAALKNAVAELTAAGTNATEEELVRVRELVLEQRQWLFDWLEAAESEVQSLREELPEASPARDLEIENTLTLISTQTDRLLAMLVDNSENLAALDIDPQWESLDENLLRRAELTAARIQKALDDIAYAESQLEKVRDAEATEALEGHLDALREKIAGTTASLRRVTALLDERGLEVAHFRELLLEATGELSVEDLDAIVALGVIEQWASRLRGTLVESGPIWLLRTVFFLLILAIAWVLSRVVHRVLKRVLDSEKADFSQLLEKFIVSTAANLVLFLGILVALSQVGIEIAPFLAGLGVAGLVLGLALQDTLSNLFSGLMILLMRPYDVDDVVDAAGVSGTVREMNLMTTTVLTFDNKKLVIPNNKIWGDTIQNVTAQDLRRVDLEFGVGYGDDTEQVASVLGELVEEHELILDDPAPNIRLHRLDDSAVTFIVRPWVKREDYWTVYWDLMRDVKRRFDAEGITIPFPQRDIHVISESAESTDGSKGASEELDSEPPPEGEDPPT